MNAAEPDSNSSTLTTSRYAFQLADSRLWLDNQSSENAFGELLLTLDAEANRISELSLRIAAQSEGERGIISLRAWSEDAYGDNYLFDDGSFEVPVQAGYLDEQIIARRPLQVRDTYFPDILSSPPDFFSGIFHGQLSTEDETSYLKEAEFIFSLVQTGVDERYSAQTIALRIETTTALSIIPSFCDRNPMTTYHKTIRLQLVRFAASHHDLNPTGANATKMAEEACRIWKPGGITCIIHEPTTVINGTLKTCDPMDSANLTALYNARPIKAISWIPVFFVEFNLDVNLGGANTTGFAINMMYDHASVVLTQQADVLALAHELGHVMGGLHPGDAGSGFWEGDVETVLNFNPFPEINSAFNCCRATSPISTGTNYSSPVVLTPGSTWQLATQPPCSE